MTPSLIIICFLGLSPLSTAAKFNQIFQWNEFDFKWPSEAIRTKALRDGTFKPENIDPRFMAVYGTRLFLSLYNDYAGVPVSLVSLPTNSASSAPPKLTPVPSWNTHGKEDCDKIERAKGLEVDSVGRLWVLDSGSSQCKSKIWTIDLMNNDQTKLIHQFPFHSLMHDLVIDETPNETFAYISRGGVFEEQHIVVFSLERNESWIVDTPGIEVFAIALSPKMDREPRQLYFGRWESNQLYSISVAALRDRTGAANPKLIGNWTALYSSYRMLMDNNGTMYAAFLRENYISSWNTSQPFAEERLHEVEDLNPHFWPLTFSLDQSGNLWMTVLYNNEEPRCRLLKAAVGEKSLPDDASGAEAQSRMLIDSSVFFVFLLAMAIS